MDVWECNKQELQSRSTSQNSDCDYYYTRFLKHSLCSDCAKFFCAVSQEILDWCAGLANSLLSSCGFSSSIEALCPAVKLGEMRPPLQTRCCPTGLGPARPSQNLHTMWRGLLRHSVFAMFASCYFLHWIPASCPKLLRFMVHFLALATHILQC